jgi:ABC-2 type transport system permease protein
MFSLLLKIRLLSFFNVARQTATRSVLLTAGLTAVGAVLFVAVFLGFKVFLGLSVSEKATQELVIEIFYFLFLFLLAGAVPFVASTLLQSSDYLLLLASPVKPRAVVAAKLLDATVTNSLQFTVIGIPAIASCAATMGIGGVWWLFVVVLTLLFVFVPALATALVLLASLSMFGMHRVRKAIAVVNLTMAAIVCLTIVVQVNRLPIRRAYGFQNGAFQADRLTSTLLTSSPSAHASPSGWFATALISVGQGHFAEAIRGVGLISIVVVALFALCTLLGERLLVTGSLEGYDEGGPAPLVRNGPGNDRPGLRRLIGFPVFALMTKDLRFIARDSVLLGQLGMPVVLFFVPFALAMQEHLRGMTSPTELYYISIGMTGFILFMQSSILSLSSIGVESRAFWMLLTSPNQSSGVLWGKFLTCVFVSSGISCALTLFNGFVFHADYALVGFQCVIITAMSMALCGMGVGLSACLPRFVYENPAHRVSAWALILGFFSTVGYLFVSAIILLATFLLASQVTERAMVIYIFGATLFGALTLTCALLPMAIGARRLSAYQWTH